MEETKKAEGEKKELKVTRLPAGIPSNMAPKEKPNKEEAIKNKRARFQT